MSRRRRPGAARAPSPASGPAAGRAAADGPALLAAPSRIGKAADPEACGRAPPEAGSPGPVAPGRDPGDQAATDEGERTGPAQSPRHLNPPQDNACALDDNACVPVAGRPTVLWTDDRQYRCRRGALRKNGLSPAISNSQARVDEITRSVGRRSARDLLEARDERLEVRTRAARGGAQVCCDDERCGGRDRDRDLRPARPLMPAARARRCPVPDLPGNRRPDPGSIVRADRARFVQTRRPRRPAAITYALSAVGPLRSRQPRHHLMNQIAPYYLGVACSNEPD